MLRRLKKSLLAVAHLYDAYNSKSNATNNSSAPTILASRKTIQKYEIDIVIKNSNNCFQWGNIAADSSVCRFAILRVRIYFA